MILEFITSNYFMSGVLAFGVLSIFTQWIVMLSLKGYVKASANMKTTKKKVMINLKNQFEAMYEMNSKVTNMDAYVDKYMLKLRFMGATYSAWERLPFISAGITVIAMVAGGYYGYTVNAADIYYAQILAAGGIILACLYMFYHIFSIKTRKQQIHVQLVDYLENYLSNRLNKTVDKDVWDDVDQMVEDAYMKGKNDTDYEVSEQSGENESDPNAKNTMEEDMDMLKRLIKEIDAKKEIDVKKEIDNATDEVAVSHEEQSDIELLEEFVQSFLS